jgi:hypothetical protein
VWRELPLSAPSPHIHTVLFHTSQEKMGLHRPISVSVMMLLISETVRHSCYQACQLLRLPEPYTMGG